ncbi:hypothetical protein MBH78_02045 [Oceanimonas sp. NS1]|nr:hypothetical protein [Oceanimonas sp. NS1]
MPHSHEQVKSGLARSLAASAILDSAQLEQACSRAVQEAKPLSTVLVETQLLSSEELARFCEREFGLPLVSLDDFDTEEVPSQYLSMDLIERHYAIPVHLRGKVLYLAMSDPTNVAALEDFGFRFNLVTDTLLVEESKLQQLLNSLQQNTGTGLDLDNIADDDIAGLELGEDPRSGTTNPAARKTTPHRAVYQQNHARRGAPGSLGSAL